MSALQLICKWIRHFQCVRISSHITKKTSHYNLCKYYHGTLSTILVYCSSNTINNGKPIKFPDSSRLSHEELIQNACTATVNSASQLLTSTLVAVVDIGQKYRKALEDQLSLLEESLKNMGNAALQDELTDLITEARNNVDTYRRNFMELDSLMGYVEKVVNSAAETSFFAGAETACTTLSERLHSAKTAIDEEKRIIKRLEEELISLQRAVISRHSAEKKDG